MKENYLKLITKIERLHRLFLEVLKSELIRMEIQDINNVQCLILYNIGRDKTTVGDLMGHGYYLGSNVTYNSQKLIQAGYLLQKTNPNDRRSVHVELSPKGIELYEKLHEMFTIQTKALNRSTFKGDQMIVGLCDNLSCLEKFWVNLRGISIW